MGPPPPPPPPPGLDVDVGDGDWAVVTAAVADDIVKGEDDGDPAAIWIRLMFNRENSPLLSSRFNNVGMNLDRLIQRPGTVPI